MAGRAGRFAAAGLLALALGVRVALIVGQPHFTPFADAASYDRHAEALALHGTYPSSEFAPGGGPTAVRPPLYPVVLGATYKLTGTAGSSDRYVPGRLAGAFLGVVTVALIGLLAMMLWGRAAALWSMALAAIYPPLVYVSDSLLSEALFTPLVLAAVAATLAARRASRPYPTAALAGALLGLAALTRSNGAIVIVALVGAMLGLPRPQRLRGAAAVVAAFLVVLTPWIVRNAIVLHTPTITTQTGYTLAGTYNDAARTDPVNPASWRPPLMPPYAAIALRRDLDEAQIDARLRAMALDYAADHPLYVGRVLFWNSLRMAELTGRAHEHLGARETGIGPRLSDIGRWAFWLVLALALVGVIRVPVVRATPWFVTLVPLLLLTIVVAVASARYREPADAFLLLPAGVALTALTPNARNSLIC